ncbi:hypothetical protein QTJ16_004520 [Diplocarpon rosae]|uniref:Zn(2)-C6 fungal-type domain-containing protein n=1 Tax=Diplocarpon rosae TaxID=946125 RepID=A0AAD9SXB7_9HELO|nr:hypothetical protein QTJ16_004520 [Diplocarpon rosae]
MSGGRKRACDTCHARKIHCDGATPSCDWCSHQGLVCTFERSTAKHGAQGTQRSRTSRPSRENTRRGSKFDAERADVVEGTLLLTPFPSTPASLEAKACTRLLPSSSLGRSSRAHRSPPFLLAHDLRVDKRSSPPESQGWAWKTSPFFATESREWIRRWTGESATLDLLSPMSAGSPCQRELHHPVLTVETTVTDLPEKSITEQYLQLYRSTPFRLVFPLVDTVLFKATIDSAYKQDGDALGSIACVFAFLAIMSHQPWVPKSNASFDGDVCARQADLMMGMASPETNLAGLQFYTMQCMYKLFSGNMKAATIYHAIACRILFMMGGHLLPQPSLQACRTKKNSDLERRAGLQLRKLFWLCYTFDKIIALRTEEPPCIDDDHCDLTLPPGYADVFYCQGDFDPTQLTNLTLFPGDLRLSIIKSRTCKLRQLSSQARSSESEVLRVVRELDEQLESWRLTIPLHFRPTLCQEDSNEFDPDMDSSQKMHIIMIHLEYYHLIATIHGITSRSFAWTGGDGVSLINPGLGIDSSQALSVEASRASLEYLRLASRAILGTTFWIIVFYPMKAILTIIGNTLLEPLEPSAERDMKLLESTAELIKWIRGQRSIQIDNADISRMDTFVSEVIQLGNSAIALAKKERKELEQEDIDMICDTI